ncbi:MAG: hypothetical protein F6K28_55410, partial [Microcoleus sp. SIO2G3]|nr:hypothetical protein [Microcoleus sp. SIO2G3]
RDRPGGRECRRVLVRARQELQLHASYAQSWSVNLQEVELGAGTRRYTDFLIATAWGQEVGLITVAMLPCMRLYAFLGQMLAQPQIPTHQYADWIRTYSGSEFTPLVQQLAELADRHATNVPIVQSTYRYAMECELAFFEASWNLK